MIEVKKDAFSVTKNAQKIECGQKCPGTSKCKGCPDKGKVIDKVKAIYK